MHKILKTPLSLSTFDFKVLFSILIVSKGKMAIASSQWKIWLLIRSLIAANCNHKTNYQHQANQLHTTLENWLLMKKQVFVQKYLSFFMQCNIKAVKNFIINWKYSCSAYKTSRKLLPDENYCADNLNHIFDTDITYGKNSECKLDHRKVEFLYFFQIPAGNKKCVEKILD